MTHTYSEETNTIIVDLVLEERNAIRESYEFLDDADKPDTIKRYNILAEAFNLEEWSERG